MASNATYYDMRDAKVNIAHRLMRNGWTVYGYHADKSDSMTDYYDPASWDWIAEKNGFILCVDIEAWKAKESGKPITKYDQSVMLSADDMEKIKKLEAITIKRGATAGEQTAAEEAITRIKAKKPNNVSPYVVIGHMPTFQANPGKCKWHIEKNGKIYDKGTGITKYSDIPSDYEFDFDKMVYTSGWRQHSEISAELRKTITEFQQLLQRWERVISAIHMGDGTAETEAKGMEQHTNAGYEKVIKAITKTVSKPVQVNRNTINQGDFLTFSHHGGYWIVTDIYQNNVDKTCILYENVGKKYQKIATGKRYYMLLERLQKGIEAGNIKVFEMQEVTETENKETWEKVATVKKTEQKQEQPATTETATATDINEYEITADTDTRDNSPLWVVKIKNRLSRDEYIKVAEQMKALTGYYSKFKAGFIFKYDPSGVLSGADNSNASKEQARTQVKTQEEQQEENNQKLTEKIDSAIDSLQNKIDSVSGEHKTNTWKRQNEQAGREAKKESWEIDIKILQYIKDKITADEKITNLERSLVVSAFRDVIHGYYVGKYGKYPRAITFPQIDTQCPDSWWNKEVPKKQAQLKKYGIFNSIGLNNAVDEYREIYDNRINRKVDRTAQEIKRKESEYKMQQKGDIQFTTSKELLAQLMDYADIQESDTVLEPSAGIGCIADEIKKHSKNLDVCEYSYSYADLLKLKGYNVVANDFMEHSKQYNKIVANVPFSVEQEHIKHIYECLKEGGTAVVITSPHWTFANDNNSKQFRSWLDSLTYEVYDVPSGSFEFTNVNCKILCINK